VNQNLFKRLEALELELGPKPKRLFIVSEPKTGRVNLFGDDIDEACKSESDAMQRAREINGGSSRMIVTLVGPESTRFIESMRAFFKKVRES